MKTKTADKQSPTSLVGQFFHSLNVDTGKIEWQGVVIGNPESGWYLLQLFEWLLGEPNVRRLVHIEEMRSWLFYSDGEQMDFSYQRGAAAHLRTRSSLEKS